MGKRMNLYLHMTLCGSICTILYFLFNHIPSYELPLKWRQFWIKFNIILYLLPVPWFVAKIKAFINWNCKKGELDFQQLKYLKKFGLSSVSQNFVVWDKNERIIYITGLEKWMPVFIVLFAVSLIRIVRWIVIYQKAAKLSKKNAVLFDTETCAINNILELKVPIYLSPQISSPAAVGIVKPMILLPSNYEPYADSLEEVLLHEYCHIANKDTQRRFWCFMVLVVQWFNPLAYYINQENRIISELLCDEVAVSGRTKKKKADYIRCILEAGQKDNISEKVLSLSASKSMLKKRMEHIMQVPDKVTWKKHMTVLIVLFLFFASTIPVFAYQKPCEITDIIGSSWDNTDMFVITPYGENNYLNIAKSDVLNLYGKNTSSFDGNLDKNNFSQNWIKCSHIYR